MHYKHQKVILVLILIVTFFCNCQDPNNPNNPNNVSTTVTQDKANIETLLDDLLTDIQNLKAGCGIQAIDNFLNMNQGVVLNQVWAETVYNTLEAHLNIMAYQTNRFTFSNHLGTHTYNSTAQQWTKTNSPTTEIVLEFPDQMNATSNTVNANLSGYVDQQVSYSGYTYWLPTAFDLVGDVSGSANCLGLKLNNATYDNTSFQIPTTVDFVLTFAPFTFEVKANKITPTQFSFDITVKNNGTEAFKILLTEVNIIDSDYENFYYYDDLATMEGSIVKGDFEIPFTADFESARQLFNPSDLQINTLFDADILYKGTNIGDFDYQSNSNNSNFDILITYKDGTGDNTNVYYNNFLDRLEITIAEFTGAW